MGIVEALTDRVRDLATYTDESSRKGWIDTVLTPAIQAAQEKSHTIGDGVAKYPDLTRAWQTVLGVIQARLDAEAAESEDPDEIYHPDRETDWFGVERNDLWYAINRIKNTYRNIHVYKTAIFPELDRYLSGNQVISDFHDRMDAYQREHPDAGLSTDEQFDIFNHFVDTKKEGLIGDALLKKKPGNGEVFKAVFPELPFADRYFERVVASWSISAHALSTLSAAEMVHCWEETSRVLRVDGKAYIFPLNYDTSIDLEDLLTSLADASGKYGFTWHLQSRRHGALSADDSLARMRRAKDLYEAAQDNPEEWILDAYPTLVIEQRDARPETGHLSSGVLPIRLCIDNVIESGKAQLDQYREKLANTTKQIDVHALAVSLQRDGHVAGGDGDDRYVLSAIGEQTHRIENYADATGIFMAGIDNETGRNIGFMSYQKPHAVLKAHGAFFPDLQKHITRFNERCKAGSIDAVIFGGRRTEIGETAGATSALEYGTIIPYDQRTVGNPVRAQRTGDWRALEFFWADCFLFQTF
ncbi:MAG: hypothetical protein AAB947_00015 [Patescibacteria group bacterium]